MKHLIPDGEPELDELDKFKGLIISVLTVGDTRIPCSDATEAKNLRRRFYRLREALDFVAREAAMQVVFSLEGHRIRCSRKVSWTDKLGARNAPDSQRNFSSRN